MKYQRVFQNNTAGVIHGRRFYSRTANSGFNPARNWNLKHFRAQPGPCRPLLDRAEITTGRVVKTPE